MLTVIETDDEEKWDSIVQSFPDYDVSYLCGYAKAFQLLGDGKPLLFYIDDGNKRAMNVSLKRDIAEAAPFKGRLAPGTWFDLSTPYGYGGFWMEGGEYAFVNAVYDSYCKENHIVSEFIRFHLFSGYRPFYNGLSETNIHNVVRTLDLPLDEMLMDFEHKVRKNLKRAGASGLSAETDYTGDRLDEFLEIYYRTMNRREAKTDFHFPRKFFDTLNGMEGHYVYFHVWYEGKIISTELVLYGTENCYSFLGGTDCEYFDLRPNDFLKYEIIKWAKEKGLKRYVLGGGYGEDDGIFHYKKSFAPNGICNFYIGKKIFNACMYRELIEMRARDASFTEKPSYFPGYRR